MLINKCRKHSLRIAACSSLALFAAVLANLPTQSQAQDDANWDFTINYGQEVETPVIEKSGMTYEQAYNAIPFNRVEYDANPSYRHDSAMELLFNELRPTTIIRTQSASPSKYPSFNNSDFRWLRFNNYVSPYYNYYRGY